MVRELKVSIASVPMQNAFGHARAVRQVAENVIVEIDLGDAAGIGEAVPREYVTGETTSSAFEFVAGLSLREIEGPTQAASFEDAIERVAALRLHERRGSGGGLMHAGAAALECALLDSLARRFRRPFADVIDLARRRSGLPESRRTAPGISRVWDLSTSLEEFIAQGTAFHHVKVKALSDLEETARRIAVLRMRIGDHVPVSVDANMAWSFEEALRAARIFSEVGLAWLEEPIEQHRLDLYRQLRRDGGMAVMLDESVRTLEEATRAVQEEACDSVNIRVSKVGGIFPATEMVAALHRLGAGYQLGVQVGEMGPLRAEILHLAYGVPGWLACEAGQPHRWFASPLTDPPPALDRETYTAPPPSGDGLGVKFVPTFPQFVIRSAVVRG